MLKFSDLIIYSSEALRTALQRMTQNRRGVLFVCDEDGHLVGVLSDGDVRRSLLDNTLLISPIDKVMNTDPISASNVQEATGLLRRMNIVAVPVVDSDGKIREMVVEDRDSVLVLSNEVSDASSDIVIQTGALAVIPARGGSKRIPKKNLANVGGKSLLAWTIQAAKNAQKISHILVSSDDIEIIQAARAMGIDVPWSRPEALSTDTTSTLDVVLHSLNWAVQNLTPVPEFAVLLEPTAPLRTGEQIDEAISLLMNSDADCVAAVSELPHVFHPEEVLIFENGLLQPYLGDHSMDARRLRNEQGSAYVLNGLVYALRIQSVLAGNGLFGRKTIPMITRWQDFLDIDTPEDLELANFKIGRLSPPDPNDRIKTMAKAIHISGRAIGPLERCFVIAEACDNHLGDTEVAKEMVRQAKACGVDAIKFQHHLPDEEMLRTGVPMSGNFDIPLFEFLERYALKLDQHYELFQYCKELGIIYLCTPFSRKAAEEINEMGVDAYKIGSGELTDLPTLKVIASFGKPMILSTGMAEWHEIDETVETLRLINDQIVLMNCVSEYPARHADVNLNVIQEMARRYDVIVGHSDHTPDIYTSIAAVALGAKLIEKHFILDRRQPGPDRSVSIEPYELCELVKGVHRVEEALGSNKTVHDLEKQIRSWAHRSVVSLRPIAKGSRIAADMVWTKRPGTGIAAKHLDQIISRTAVCDIPADHLIQWEELA